MGIVAEEILLKTIKTLIEETRRNVATVVNSSLTLMYWHIGKKINDELLGNERAKYGKEILATLSQQLSWSHFRELLPLDDKLKIEFYAEMSIADCWSVRTLSGRIDSMLYERTALSKKPDELIKYEI